MRKPIYKVDGRWFYNGGVDLYIVKNDAELESIPQDVIVQFAIVQGSGSGATSKLRLPGESWVEV